MKKTKIEWCDSTLNPVVGCTHGCTYCYARKMNDRFGWIRDFATPQFFPERLKQLESKKPQSIFMNSMSDIADWKTEWADTTIAAMNKNPQHKYLFLTKRAFIYDEFFIDSMPNLWIGMTATDDKSFDENEYYLREMKSHYEINTFVSLEPLSGELSRESLKNIRFFDWVIIGAETGNRKGKVIPKKEWIDKIVYACDIGEVPVFMKDSLIPIVGEENMRRDFPW